MTKLIRRMSVLLMMGISIISIGVKAATLPDVHQPLELTVELNHYQQPLQGEVAIYQIAELTNADGGVVYQVLKEYQTIHPKLDQTTAQQSQQYAKDFSESLNQQTLKALVKSDDKGNCWVPTGKLQPGMYLVVPQKIVGYLVDPFLVAVPSYQRDDGTQTTKWNYAVICKPKSICQKEPENDDASSSEEGKSEETNPQLPSKDDYDTIPQTGDDAKDSEQQSFTGGKLPQTGTKGVGGYNSIGMGMMVLVSLFIKKSCKDA